MKNDVRKWRACANVPEYARLGRKHEFRQTAEGGFGRQAHRAQLRAQVRILQLLMSQKLQLESARRTPPKLCTASFEPHAVSLQKDGSCTTPHALRPRV